MSSVRLLPVYILFIPLWAMAGIGKFMAGGVPPQFVEKFSTTFIAQFPGTTFAFYKIAVLETLTALLFIVSLLKGEFLSGKPKHFLHWGMFFSLLMFSILCFGLRISGTNDMATQLFFYFAATCMIWVFVAKE